MEGLQVVEAVLSLALVIALLTFIILYTRSVQSKKFVPKSHEPAFRYEYQPETQEIQERPHTEARRESNIDILAPDLVGNQTDDFTYSLPSTLLTHGQRQSIMQAAEPNMSRVDFKRDKIPVVTHEEPTVKEENNPLLVKVRKAGKERYVKKEEERKKQIAKEEIEPEKQ